MNLQTAQEQVIAVFDRIHPVSPALADSILNTANWYTWAKNSPCSTLKPKNEK